MVRHHTIKDIHVEEKSGQMVYKLYGSMEILPQTPSGGLNAFKIHITDGFFFLTK